ncbi:MAG: hypothetical protein GY778_23860 [bacterium]|nr:hypothetical protein [bacterium]
MTPTLVKPSIRRMAIQVFVPAAMLVGAGCQAVSGGGGGGGGGNAANPDDVVAGAATYNQACAQCHGTPGAFDGDAPDLAGTTAGAIAAKVTGNDHGGGRIEGFLDRHYREISAYLAGGGGDGGGQGGGGGNDGEWGDDGADVNTACYFATPVDIMSVRQSVQTDYLMGVGKDDELSMMAQGCQYNTNIFFDDCVACAAAIVDEIYP